MENETRHLSVFVLSYALPPVIQPQSIQVGRLLMHLPPSWHLYGATVDDASAGTDGDLYPDLASRFTEVVRVGVAHPTWLKLFRRLLRLPFQIPDTFLYAQWRLVRRARRQLRNVRFDLVMTCPAPMSSAVLGPYLKRLWGCPWILVLSDPWADNPHFGYSGVARRINDRLEAWALSRADVIFVPSSRMKSHYERKYPGAVGQVSVLRHSFDPGAYRLHPVERVPGPSILLRSVGSLDRLRTPEGLLRGLALARARGLAHNLRVELVGPGVVRRQNEDLVSELGLNGVVTLKGSVGYAESLHLMSTADVLVTIDAAIPGSIYLPSKIADYVGTGRPILALTPRDGEVAGLLSDRRSWVAPPDDPEAVAEVLADVATGHWSHAERTVTNELRSEFDIRNVVATFVARSGELAS